MVKIVYRVDGMRCGMCEAHVNDAVRKAADVKRVSSSCTKGETVVIAEDAAASERIRAAIEAQGYRVLSVTCEPYEKRGLFHRK